MNALKNLIDGLAMHNKDNTDDIEASLLQALAMQEAEAAAEYSAYAGFPKPEGEKTASREDVIEALKTVSDPEIMINIYDMGLIYKLEIKDNGDVYIEMTLTAPGCPVAGILPQQTADAAALVEGTGKVEVKVVWEPAWTLDRLSDEARAVLDVF